jgi:hypothetical protein
LTGRQITSLFEEIFGMGKLVVAMCCTLGFGGTLFGMAFAGETGHYVNGVEGIKAATLPPPGFYYRMYNVYYDADEITDEDGDELDVGLDIHVYALVNRFVWISDIKMLGADFGADVIIPLVYTDLEIKAFGVDDDEFGLGDIAIEPFVLSWHGARYDASFGLAVYVPTGETDEAAAPGKDFWTGLITLGGTYYFDVEKTWSASILSRYEIHSEKDETDVRPGNDTGSDVQGDKGVHDRVFAVGPEVIVFIPPAKSFLSLRSLWEFEAKDRTEGQVIALTLTKAF